MDIVRCNQGHFYDASIHPSCPQCADEAAMGGVINSIGPTEPVGAASPIGPTEPVGAAAPAINPGFTPADFASVSKPQTGGVQAYDPTQPVWLSGTKGFDPVTGWLVCIDGPDKGTDYRIHSGYNYIGRAPHMDICIRNDSHISHDKHALIGYDDESQMFFFAPDSGRNIVRVNDKPVISSVELSAHDILTIGATKLMFVPFCGESFRWNTEK